jgi:GT2 family glycosyltransferase
MQPKVSIIIINWNGYGDTIELLNSLSKIIYQNYKIFLVDNKSDGDDVQKLKCVLNPGMELICNNINAGFSGGNNIGIKSALKEGTDFILLLNNDTVVEPDFLNILVEGFKLNEKTAITAPRINYYYKPEKIWSSGGKISSIRGSGFALADVMENETDKEVKQVTFVSGCCMLIKKDLFETVGFFDDNYFLYLEDTDLCTRTIKAGYKIIVMPQSKILHKVKASSKRVNSNTLYYEVRNRLFFARKNFNKVFAFTFFYILSTMMIKSAYWLGTGKKDNVISVTNSFKDFFSGRMGKRIVNTESGIKL